jgi:hypothetical protein
VKSTKGQKFGVDTYYGYQIPGSKLHKTVTKLADFTTTIQFYMYTLSFSWCWKIYYGAA